MSDLYDKDIVLWSERQAALLRQHAATARVNDTIGAGCVPVDAGFVARGRLRGLPRGRRRRCNWLPPHWEILASGRWRMSAA
jgi:hypothetical protein